MGHVYRCTYTKPVPARAEVVERKGQRVARWRDSKGKIQTAPITIGKDNQPRIVQSAAKFTARYTDASGVTRIVATGCKDETAAKQVLANLEKRVDKVRSGIRSASEDAVIDHQVTPLSQHLADYYAFLEASEVNAEHLKNVKRHLNRISTECRFQTMADLNRSTLERWLAQQTKKGMGARTRNMHLAAAIAFANWCLEPGNERLTANPFARLPKADEKADRRRQRRAMTETELEKLLAFAHKRPLVEALTIRRGKNKGQPLAKVRDEVRQRLELLGHERALIYKTLVLTGLRQSELASLKVNHLHLKAKQPYADLSAAAEKNGQGSPIPLRADLVADLRQWIATKGLSAALPLFTVPDKLIKILDKDLEAAGIPKQDERGWTIDVHALRHSFISHLASGNVTPRTTQAAARHSTIDLTMNVYTDPKMLDVHAALDVLPALPLNGRIKGQANTATGTFGREQLVAQLVAQPDKAPQAESKTDKVGSVGDVGRVSNPRNKKAANPLNVVVCGSDGAVETKGIEPSTPGLQSRCSPN